MPFENGIQTWVSGIETRAVNTILKVKLILDFLQICLTIIINKSSCCPLNLNLLFIWGIDSIISIILVVRLLNNVIGLCESSICTYFFTVLLIVNVTNVVDFDWLQNYLIILYLIYPRVVPFVDTHCLLCTIQSIIFICYSNSIIFTFLNNRY